MYFIVQPDHVTAYHSAETGKLRACLEKGAAVTIRWRCQVVYRVKSYWSTWHNFIRSKAALEGCPCSSKGSRYICKLVLPPSDLPVLLLLLTPPSSLSPPSHPWQSVISSLANGDSYLAGCSREIGVNLFLGESENIEKMNIR